MAHRLHKWPMALASEAPIPVGDWPDRVRLPFDIDAAQARAGLQAFDASDWTRHFVHQNYEGDWSVLPLRAPRGATHAVRMIYSDPMATDYVDTPFLARAPQLQAMLALFDCPLQSVRLMRLTPGSTINEHCDFDLDAALGRARLHIPLSTNDAVAFKLNGSAVEMVPGSVWYLRLADPHCVHNGGNTDRVHLVVDATVNEWLARQLDTGVRAPSHLYPRPLLG